LSIDWELAVKIGLGGYGVTILILIILALVTLAMGLILQRPAKDEKGGGTEEGEG